MTAIDGDIDLIVTGRDSMRVEHAMGDGHDTVHFEIYQKKNFRGPEYVLMSLGVFREMVESFNAMRKAARS